MTQNSDKQHALRLVILACLPFVLSACAHSPADDQRAALLRKSAEVDKSYLNYFRGARSVDLSKRRLKAIVTLIKRIENQTSYEIIDRGLEDALNEARRIYPAEANELCEVIHLAGAYYEKHSKSEKSEQLYRRHIDSLIPPNKQSRLQKLKLKPQVASAASEDMQLLSILLNRKGKSKEALEYRQRANLLRGSAPP